MEELHLLIDQYADNSDRNQNPINIAVNSLSIDRMDRFSSSPPLLPPVATSHPIKRPVSAQSSSPYKPVQDVSLPRLSSPPPPITPSSPLLKPSVLSTTTKNNDKHEDEKAEHGDHDSPSNNPNKDNEINNHSNTNGDDDHDHPNTNHTEDKPSVKQPNLFSLDTTAVHSFIDMFYTGGRRLIRMVESSFLEKFGLHVSIYICR